MKKFCAVFGMIKNEPRFLPLWIKYYSDLFGMENLYVLDHYSTDGSTKDLNCNVEKFGKPARLYEDRDSMLEALKNKQIELLKEYQHVICVDVDEFVFVTKYENLKHYIESCPGDVPECTGYEIIHQKNEKDLDWDKPILIKQRNKWIRLNTYDKKIIVSEITNWSHGRHYVYNDKNSPRPQKKDKNLILCHLHRVDYNNCKEKFLCENNVYYKKKGFPLFANKEFFDNYFYEPDFHTRFGAAHTVLEEIPKEFENII
jgi:hypothetical protein